MLACLALELVVNALAHGDPFVRLKVDGDHGSPVTGLTRTDALLRFPRSVENYPQTLAVLATVVLMVLGALLVRRRGNVLMLVWFLWVWLPLTAVSGLIDPGFIRINASLMRYWVPTLPSLCLGAAAAVAAALAFVRHRLPEGSQRHRAGPHGGRRGRRAWPCGACRCSTTSGTTRATARGTPCAPTSRTTTTTSTGW